MGFSLGSILSSAKRAIQEVVDSGPIKELDRALGGNLSSSIDTLSDVFEQGKEVLSKGRKILKDVQEIATAGSFGRMLNVGLDKIGLPDIVGDVAGCVLDVCTGNIPGAISNGLDVAEDVAKACGGDELAGYLKAGANITGMFSGPSGMGRAAEVISTVGKAAGALDGGLNAVELLAGGDIVGGGKALLGAMGEAAGVGKALGVSEEKLEWLNKAVEHGGKAMSFLEPALADGKLGVDDLQHLPVADLAKKAGVPEKYHDMLQPAAQLLGALATGGDPSEALGGVAEQVLQIAADKGIIPSLDDTLKTVLGEGVKFAKMAQDNPDAAQLAKSWLESSQLMREGVALSNMHAQLLRM